MKKSTIYYGISLFFLMLLAACTQNDMNVDNTQNEAVTPRSTQAECDSLENDLPDQITSNACGKLAELLECRLNQGINEAEVISNCTPIDDYSIELCISTDSILDNYTSVVELLQQQVSDNTTDCNMGMCSNPHPITSCRTILFEVSSTGSGSCIEEDCEYSYTGRVYCCH